MKKIESFIINHLNLSPGIYVSRRDHLNVNVLTTFDLRFTSPNFEDVMTTGAIHTIEHLGATFLRNHQEWQKKIIYFGPMGCRTGFYLIIDGKLDSIDILELIKEMISYILDFTGDIPGATAKECGNYSDNDLQAAKGYAKKYFKILNNIKDKNLYYQN